MTTKLITVNNDRTAAVNQSVPWIPVGESTPRGVKVLLINRAHGTAVIGNYRTGDTWTHWQGLPKFTKEES